MIKGAVMNKKFLTFLFIFGVFTGITREAVADFDAINNVLMVCNSTLKKAAIVPEKASTIARNITSFKISPDLGIDMDKPQKLIEKGENIKEQAERLQDRIETAKDNAAALKAKYEELQNKAMEYKAKADEAISKGKDIYDKYKTYKEEVEDAIEKGKELYEEGKEKLEEIEETAEGLGDTVNGLTDTAKEKLGLNGKEASEQPVEEESYTEQEELPSDSEEEPVEEEVEESVTIISGVQSLSNTADAISSAGTWAETGTDVAPVMTMSVDIPSITPTSVSVDDVIAAAESGAEITPISTEEEQRSSLNLEEQLQFSSNRAAATSQGGQMTKSAGISDLIKTGEQSTDDGLNPVTRAAFTEKGDKNSANQKLKATSELGKAVSALSAKVKNNKHSAPQQNTVKSGERRAFIANQELQEKTDAK